MKKIKLIVLIDDNHITNAYNEIMLEEADICEEYLFFDSPLEALDYFKEETKKETPKLPEFIFLDINMPTLSGWQFLDEYIKVGIKEIPVIIMLTTSLSPTDKEKSEEYSIVREFISKPLTEEHLKSLSE